MKIVRARAPLRLGLAGGGTDVSPYCDRFGGSVMNATIGMYAYTTIEPLEERAVEFVAVDQDRVERAPIDDELRTDGPLGLLKGTYLRVMADFNGGRRMPLRLTTHTDAPPGSGLGSSSTLVVAMVQAFSEYMSLPLGEYDVAQLAYRIERVDLALNGGKQDQYAAAFGGFNFMEFLADNRVIVNPLRIKQWVVSELESSLVLYFTGVSRASASIIDQQTRNVDRGDERAIEAMHQLKAESVMMKEALLTGNLALFSDAMRSGWLSKKKTAEGVTNPLIEEIDTVARANGAFAGKVSGAGGGGFMLFFTSPQQRPRLIAALESTRTGQVVRTHFSGMGAHSWRIR